MAKGPYYLPERSELSPDESPEDLWDSIQSRMMQEKLDPITQFQTINDFRTIALHHDRLLYTDDNDRLSNILSFFTPLVSNVRSALAKNAIIACTELANTIGGIICDIPTVGNLVHALLVRASSDKIFLRDVATDALEAIIGHESNLTLFNATLVNTMSKNRQLLTRSVHLSAECLENLPEEEYQHMDLDCIANSLGNVFSNKSAEAKVDATKMVWMIGARRNWKEWTIAIRETCKPVIAAEMLKGTPLEKAFERSSTDSDDSLSDILESPPKRLRCATAPTLDASITQMSSPITTPDISTITSVCPFV